MGEQEGRSVPVGRPADTRVIRTVGTSGPCGEDVYVDMVWDAWVGLES